ncbi:MAG: NAD(P)/FAD-dependent oxidoreductase [Opitutaceae bacterium]
MTLPGCSNVETNMFVFTRGPRARNRTGGRRAAELRPIEIIGGGLAGLSLGVALRRGGVPVTLHEAGDYPRHRVCGEFITGLDSSTIDRLGLAPLLADALRHAEVAWTIGEAEPHIQRLPAPALGLSRHELDARLARVFVSLGGELIIRSRITDTASPAGRVFASGRRRSADGRWIGLKVHVRGLSLIRDLEMHLGRQCYVGLTRIGNDAVNVCGLFARRPIRGRDVSLLLDYLRAAGLQSLSLRLSRADVEADSFCAVAALGFDRRCDARDGVRLGDAAAMIPPFTGNGMAMAFQSAEIALPVLIAYARHELEWADACRVTRMVLRRRFRLRLASAGALHPFLLRPHPQRWFALLGRARLLPFGRIYAALH